MNEECEVKCRICNASASQWDAGAILQKYSVSYYICPECGFIQTEIPYWLDEAYNESINITDTGIMQRNSDLSKLTISVIVLLFSPKKLFLDYAGGYGILTRIMRDYGVSFLWHDPYSKNLIARGFEYQGSETIEMLTCFEAFEHFISPLEELEKMLSISKNILFSTLLLPSSPPKVKDWWYFGTEHGQHISFYTVDSLQKIADTFELNFYSDGKYIHLFTEKKISKSWFKFVLLLNRFGIVFFLKRFLKSKTISDMHSIVERSK